MPRGFFNEKIDDSLEKLHKIKKMAKSYTTHQQPNFKGISGINSIHNNNINNLPLNLTVLSRIYKADLLKLLLLFHLTDLSSHLKNDSPAALLPRNQNSTFDFHAPSSIDSPDTHLAPFYQNWANITKDTWVLSIIQFGYQLESVELPPLEHIKFTSFNTILEEEVLTFLRKQAVQQVPHWDIANGFYSRYFAVPKKDGGIRSILDLRDLNMYLHPQRFWMVTLESIVHLLRRQDWFTVIDLKDAYFHISIHQHHRKFLRFIFQNIIYQFCALPFELSIVPCTFMKCMAPVVVFLRLHNIKVFPYIDDWLIVSPYRRKGLQKTNFVLHTLRNLGLTVNLE